MNIKIGTSGWNYDDFRDIFYPQGLEEKDYLSFYSKYFNSVEVNSTFYRFLFPSIIKSWNKKTPDNFEFVLKGHRFITHIKKLSNCKRYVESFFKLANLIKQKTKVILWQMPPSFKLNQKNLKKIMDFSKLIKLYNYEYVFEFRDENWWNKDVFSLFEENRIYFCSVSAPELPKDIVMINKFIYIRFHGKTKWYSYNYSKEELSEYVKRITELKPKEVYVFFNNTAGGNAVLNAIEFNRFFSQV